MAATANFTVKRGRRRVLHFEFSDDFTGMPVKFNLEYPTAHTPFLTLTADGDASALGSTFTTSIVDEKKRYTLTLKNAETKAFLTTVIYLRWFITVLIAPDEDEEFGSGKIDLRQ